MAKNTYWITITRQDVTNVIRAMPRSEFIKAWLWHIWVGIREMILHRANPIHYWRGCIWLPGYIDAALAWRDAHPIEE